MQSPDIDELAVRVQISDPDPLLADAGLPLRALYFPLGFPLEVHTNSSRICAAARASWQKFKPRFACPPLMLRIGVDDSMDSIEMPLAPICRSQGGLLTGIADMQNFFVCNLDQGFSFGWVTPQTAKSTAYLRYHILEAAALSMVAGLLATPVHAACVAPLQCGMLLCGDSGAGKSSLAFAGARAGWTFVTDDASYLPLDHFDRTVIGNCHQFRLRESGVGLFPELEGRTITPRAAGKPSIEIATSEFPDITTSDSAVVEYVIFLNRQYDGPAGLYPFPKDRALEWFSQFPIKGIESYQTHLEMIQHLLNVDVLELRYTELDWAIERLNILAVTGR